MSRDPSIQAFVDRAPGHARVLGSPGSGKTTLLVERYRALERGGHRPLVVAFGRDQYDRLLQRLIQPGTARLGPTPVTTHGLLASRILSAARPNRTRTLRDVDERVVLDRVMERGVLKSDLRSIGESSALRDALLPLLHVLAQNGISSEQADRAARRAVDPRARDVLSLFALYRVYLDEHALTTFYDASWTAARMVSSRAVDAPSASVVLVDDFQDLDAGQFALLRAIAPPGGKVALEVFGDPGGPRFSFRGTSDRFLRQEFSREYAPVDFPIATAMPSDAALARVIEMLDPGADAHPAIASPVAALPLFSGAPTRDRVPAIDTGREWNVVVEAVCASDEIAEVQHAASRVKAWIEAGLKPADVAVVARDPDRIASLVHQVFREYGVSVDAGVRGDTAVEAFVHALVGALGRDADGRFADALEASSFAEPFCTTAQTTPRELHRVVAGMRARYTNHDQLDLVRMLEECVMPLVSGAHAAAIQQIADEWQRYSEVVAHTGGRPSLDEFRHAYLDGSEPRPVATGRVPLLSARAMSGRGARAVVLLGCADGVFPRVETERGYLPIEDMARTLSGVHDGAAADLLNRVDRDAREREEMRLLLSALCSASEHLAVSYPARFANQHVAPAFALAPLFVAAKEATRAVLPPMRAVAALATRAPGDPLAARVAGLDAIADGWLAEPAPVAQPRLESCRLSPSALETFSRCERKFLYAKLFRIDEPGSIYMQIGNVFHGVMKRVVRAGADGDEVRAALRAGEFTTAFEEAFAEEMSDASDWVKELTRISIAGMVGSAAELEAERRGRYTVRSVEQMAKYPAEGDIVLSGRLDRVDVVDGIGAVVIDYKTGEMKRTAASLIDEIVDERKHWQVPVYSALAASDGPAPSAFLFYIVPPDDKPKVVGMQIVDGKLPPPIPDAGKSRSPYGVLGAATVNARLNEAMQLRAALMGGEAMFQRTEQTKECERCYFVRVCRRNQS